MEKRSARIRQVFCLGEKETLNPRKTRLAQLRHIRHATDSRLIRFHNMKRLAVLSREAVESALEIRQRSVGAVE